MEKTCTGCGQTKPQTDYYRGNAYADGYYARCKSCVKLYRSQTSERMVARSRGYRVRNKQFLWDYLLEHPCSNCSEDDPVVLHFHHRDAETKRLELAKMAHGSYSLDVIEAEIAKCDVLCGNCHLRITAEELGFYAGIDRRGR